MDRINVHSHEWFTQLPGMIVLHGSQYERNILMIKQYQASGHFFLHSGIKHNFAM